MHDDNMKNIYEETAKCIRCGYCLPTCPTYMVTGLENAVARGRNYYVKSVLEKTIPQSPKIKNAIFECLLCGACVDNCAPQVQTDEIMVAARSSFIKEFGQPLLQRYMFQEILMNPDRMTRLMKLIAFGKRSGISGLVQALRVFGWFGKNLADIETIVENFPKKFLREYDLSYSNAYSENRLNVAYFVGCGINYAFPNVGLATLQLLNVVGANIRMLDNYCCGLPAFGYGDIDAARSLAEKNLHLFQNSGFDYFITDCASCASFLKDYPKLFPAESEQHKSAWDFSNRIYDVTEFFNKFPLPGKLKSRQNYKITYHDPCHLSHYLHITAQPRQLLRNIEGVQFVELPEANWCCGGAGTYNISHHNLSTKILQRKMKNLEKTGAHVLATSCPGCLVQLSYGTRVHKLPVHVKHITEIISEIINE